MLQQATTRRQDEENAKELQFRLKHDRVTRQEPQTWNRLLRYTKSFKGKEAIEIVWRIFSEYPVDEVPVLYELDLWSDQSGRELVNYIQKLHNAGIKPPVGTLRKIGLQHHSLRFLQPTISELMEAAMEYVDVEIPENMYTTLMPRLCKIRDEKKALAWHKRLVANGDPPRKLEDVKELRQLLLDKRCWAAALEVRRDIKPDNFLSISKSQGNSTGAVIEAARDDENAGDTLQSFVSKLDERIGVSHFAPSMDDYTCARFFATKFFSVEFVMDGLALFGITKIGPLSIREIMKRTIRGSHCDTDLARQYFAKMRSLGITCDMRYARLLEHLTNTHKDVLLHNVVTCEDDPCLFDDLEYQEKKFESSDHLLVEQTRQLLLFEPGEREVEIRNILLRAGLEDFESMVAAGIPITEKTRIAMLEATFIDEAPWISETKQRAMIRAFARLPYIGATEWRNIIRTFLYLTRQHLRRDLEAVLLSLKDPKIFDFRTMANIIRWYMRLGTLDSVTRMETMLGGIKVLAALRDIGLVTDIHRACEANLVSLFGYTPISQVVDRKKRAKAQSIGNFEDFVIAIRRLYDEKMWSGMTPTEVKEVILTRAQELKVIREARRSAEEEHNPASHTGKFNPGKTWHIKKKMIKEEQVTDDPSNQ